MNGLRIPLDSTSMGPEAKALDTKLRHRIVGQDEAIRHIVSAYQMYTTGLNPQGRPVSNLLFLGPTGSGKTRTVEATAESLLGSPRAVLKVDCGEFQHSHEIAKLIGSPPGYLGHRETHPMFTQEALTQYHTDRVKLSFVLFDEIEKASDALWNLLLGILDKATLTLGDGRHVDFSRTMIFMTSNLGAQAMSNLLNPRLGFAGHPENASARATKAKMADAGVQAARRKFTPEFMNRIDKVIVFQPLGESELRKILEIELRLVQERIFRGAHVGPFAITVSEAAKETLLSEGTDTKYGARHLKRALERLVLQPLANLVASAQVNAGDWVRADLDPDLNRIVFYREAEGMNAYNIAEVVRAGFPNASAAAA